MRNLCRAVNDEVIAFHRTNNTDVKRRLMEGDVDEAH